MYNMQAVIRKNINNTTMQFERLGYIANNFANYNTVAYKTNRFEQILREDGYVDGAIRCNALQGDIRISKNPYDVAINGEGYIPVVSTIGCDDEGNIYNINADTAAARIAGALNAERLIMMTDIEGLLKDKDDPSTLIPTISVKEANELLDNGTIVGGMIPKIKCCIDAISHGVKNVTIMDGRIPHSILMELLTNEGAGTEVIA